MTCSRHRKFYPQEVQDITDVLRMFIDRHTRGIEILHGLFPFPAPDELTEMMVFLFGDEEGHRRCAEVLSVFERIGGFGRIPEVLTKYAREGTENYRLFVDHAMGTKRGRPFKNEI